MRFAHLNWRFALLLLELLFAMSFFAFIAIAHSPALEQYRNDVLHQREDCYSEINIDHRKHELDCQGFLFRTMNDPVAVFTAGLFIFTVVLAVATSILIFVTLFGILEQGRSTQKLFTLDQRPWLKVAISIRDPMFTFTETSTNINLIIDIENIGKTPAFDVVLPIFFLKHFQGEPDLNLLNSRGLTKNIQFEKIRDEYRDSVKTATLRRTITLHAGETTQLKRHVLIAKELVDRMWERPGVFYNLVCVCIPYRGSISPDHYETTIVGSIRYRFMGVENIPRNADDLGQTSAIQELIREHAPVDMREAIINEIDTSGALSIIT